MLGEGRTRKRFYNPFVGTIQLGVTSVYYLGTLIYSTVQTIPAPSHFDREVTFDQCHPGPPYKTGGPFGSTKTHFGRYEMHNTGHYFGEFSASIYYDYVGSFVLSDVAPGSHMAADMATSGESGAYSLDATDCSSYGASAWRRFKPAKPTADLGVFIGEGRDIPRMLQTTAKGFRDVWKSMGGSRTSFGPKKVADHWLNTQFGWLPFISDMNKFVKAYSQSDKLYNQLRRDNNQWVKRGGTVSDSKQDLADPVHSDVATAHDPSLPTALYQNPAVQGSYHGECYCCDKVWFEGRFKYHMPFVEPVNGMDSLQFQLWNYGARISPSLLWEITPWSWLVDYFSNVGDVMSNIDSSLYSSLVAKYAYVMRTTELIRHVDSTLHLKGGLLTASADVERVVLKGRQAANPFGFGLTYDDLSARQWSILTALGFSRSRLSW